MNQKIKNHLVCSLIREGRVAAIAFLCVVLWIGFLVWSPALATAEVRIFPILGMQTDDKGNVYQPAFQESIKCEGYSAISTGYLSKLPRLFPPQAEWQRQTMHLGSNTGRHTTDILQPGDLLDQQADVRARNRSHGVSDYTWRIRGGCITSYSQWFARAYHKPWHGLWELETVIGPFPLRN